MTNTIDAPPADSAGQLAWVAPRTAEELAAAGVRLDVDEICEGIAATYVHCHLEPELLERRAHMRGQVGRAVRGATTYRHCSAANATVDLADCTFS